LGLPHWCAANDGGSTEKEAPISLLDLLCHMEQAYQLRTKHKSKLLFAMMNALAGEDASISFEGRLSNTCLVKIAGGRFEETEVLRRRKL